MINRFLLILAVLVLVSTKSFAQVTITGDDMFNVVGQFYRSYVNASGNPVPVSGIIGEKGGPQRWDFSSGPEDQVFRFDYIDPRNTVIGVDFPDATIAEKKTEEATGSEAWLLFDQVPGLGRRVYGFWDLGFDVTNPATLFDNPIIDFPDQINFGDTWSTSATYDFSLLVFGFDVRARITQTTEFEADAWGFVDLPNLGLGDCLRVNQLDIISTAIDLDGSGQFTNVDEQFVRTFYWMRPGQGLAAQMTSLQSVNPPGDNFAEANFFLRMFETNKEITGGCNGPEPVQDLKLETLDRNRILLSWSEAECTRQYRIEVNSVGPATDDWEVVETTTNTLYLDVTAASSAARFYRVVSLP